MSDDDDAIPSHEFVGPRRPFILVHLMRPENATVRLAWDRLYRLQRRLVVFCDGDGVWHGKHGQRFSQLPLLEAWLAKHREVMLVLTTSWREHQPLERLRELFKPELRRRVIDVTPVVKSTWWTKAPRHVRYVEIQQWLATAAVASEMQNVGYPKGWAILDDQAELFPPGCKNLVLVDGNRGLQEADLARLDVVLDAQWKEGQ